MLTITWTWTCSICGMRKEERSEHYLYGSVLEHFVEIPSGWSKVGDQLICPHHTIVIDPPEKESPDEPKR